MSRIKVTVEGIGGRCDLPVHVGDVFFVEDSRLLVPPGGSGVCIWALQSMMPVFPLLNEKKSLRRDHWVHGAEIFTCPDPEGRVRYRLEVVEE